MVIYLHKVIYKSRHVFQLISCQPKCIIYEKSIKAYCGYIEPTEKEYQPQNLL